MRCDGREELAIANDWWDKLAEVERAVAVAADKHENGDLAVDPKVDKEPVVPASKCMAYRKLKICLSGIEFDSNVNQSAETEP